jgi:hypothetical protein
MSKTNFDNLMRLLADKDARTLEVEGSRPITVEKVPGSPFIVLRHNLKARPLLGDEVRFRVQGDTARAVYFRDRELEWATEAGHFPQVPVFKASQRITDGLVSSWWNELEHEGFFAAAREQQIAESGRGRSKARENNAAEQDWLQETAMPTAEDYRQSRVQTAERALSLYSGQDREVSLTDLLADAMHWSRENEVDFDRCLGRARGQYRSEVAEATEELSGTLEKQQGRGRER